MQDAKQRQLLDVWDFARVNWKAQMLGNIFFGLPLIILVCLAEGFSALVVLKVSLLYISLYLFFFVPFYGVTSAWTLRPIDVVFDRIRLGQNPTSEEARRTLEKLLNLPLRIAWIVAISVPPAFIVATVSFRFGLIPEFLPILSIISLVTIALGLVVAAIHAFLVYIFSETYLRPAIEFLLSRSEISRRELKISKTPLFRKILLLVLITTAASLLSLGTFFISKIAMDLPGELMNVFLSVSAVVFLSFVFVIVIATVFTRNLTYPLERLADWANRLTRGDFRSKINVMTNDEISDVVECLKDMVGELEESRGLLEIKVAARTQELQEVATSLEEQVGERTRELQEKLGELERINRLAVGRELKMIELKKEISRLKEELERVRNETKKKEKHV